MDRQTQFVLLVQTAAIVESLTRGEWPSHGSKRSTTAAIAVHVAMEARLQENADLTEACAELIAYVYDNTIPKPVWIAGLL